MYFNCGICGCYSDDGDFQNGICLNCIDYYSDKYGQVFDLLPSDYEPCNNENRSAERCDFCIWANNGICAYKVMCTLRKKQ